MSAPPRLAVGLLARVLRTDPAAPAILGDLNEDFVEIAGARGRAAASLWYWREVVLLSLGRLRGATRLGPEPLGTRRRSSTSRNSAHRRRFASPRFAGLFQDGVYALRTLRVNPGFALFTAAVMGLGVGAATSVYSVMKPLVLAPLPFEEPHELVWIAHEAEPGDNSLAAVTQRSANLVDFRARARSFEGITGFNAYFNHAPYSLTGIDEPERLVGVDVAHDFLDVLGIEPLRGRGFLPEEGRPGGPPAVILSYDLWQQTFAGDGGIVGNSLLLNGRSYPVVGILPPSFDFSSIFSPSVDVDILLPFPVVAAGGGGFQGNTLHLIARLRPGITVEAAQAELEAILASLGRQDPGRWGLSAVTSPLQAHISGPFRPALLLLAAAAGTFLLLVCVNVSNLVFARALGRTREVAVRKALGASRKRLTRQLVIETLLISLSGAALGCALAWQMTRLVSTRAGIDIPMLDAFRVDASALVFAVFAAVLSGLLAGVFPAIKTADGREASVLRDGGSTMSGGRLVRRLRETMVVTQVALACVLLLTTGLLVRSFESVLDTDLGFDAAGTVAWRLSPSRTFETFPEKSDFFGQLTERVAAVPGVVDAGLIDELPLGINRTYSFWIVGAPEELEPGQAFPHIIDPNYLDTMGVPLIEGRNFTPDDRDDTDPVILINETAARQIFGGEPALGRRLKFWGQWEWRVVGIVKDVRHVSPEMDAGVQAYFPVPQMRDFHTLDLVVRSQLSIDDTADAVRAAIREIDPTMPTREFWTVQSMVDRAVSVRRFTLSVLGAFGAAALLIAGLGIYGVVAHSVAERTDEIGIRRALGAPASSVMWNVMSRTLALAGVGAVGGVVMALMSARLLASLVYGVSVRDPGTFVTGALVLLAVAAAAAAVPATRAARTRGLIALGRN